MTDTIPLDIVNMPEIAKRLGVKPQTVRDWKSRRDVGFPPSDFPNMTGVAGQQFWLWGTIEAWAKRTGRL